MDELLDARGGALWITGEPGIGKTALIAAVLEGAEGRRYRTLSGRAAEFEEDVPFAVIVDALEDAVTPELLDADERALLAAVFPELGPAHADVGQDERHRVLRAVRALLGRLARDEPIVLALDDLHWADASSIDLLTHVLHRGFDGPVLLVLASRPAQTPARLLSSFEEAERHRIGRRLELSPLSRDQAAELLGEAVDDALFAESGGNPFYLEQLAAAARRGAGVAPAGVSAVIRGEVASLSPGAGAFLRAAAVLGDPFDPEIAAETAPGDGTDALGALDELLERDLIRTADGPREFRFRHPLVRRAV